MRRSICGLVLGAFVFCSAPRRADAQVVEALGTVNSVLGAIANAYGTLQAGQFVASLFGIGAGTSVSAAVTELETFMRNYRDQQLVANVDKFTATEIVATTGGRSRFCATHRSALAANGSSNVERPVSPTSVNDCSPVRSPSATRRLTSRGRSRSSNAKNVGCGSMLIPCQPRS